MAYIPNYILRVYNPEYYGSSQIVAMPMQLRANEYWELTGVEGASADFMGLDVQQGADASGSLFTYPTYEDRQIEFTLAIKKGHEADAETYLSRYLQPNVYATLYNADWGEKVFMQCVIAGWSLNRYSNNVTATITIQPTDRAWHKQGVKLEFDGNKTVLQTDLPAQPYLHADFTGITDTAEVTSVKLTLTHITYTPGTYDDDMLYNEEVNHLSLVCPAGCPANMVSFAQVLFESRQIVLFVNTGTGGIKSVLLSMPMGDYNWDWALASGTWQIDCTLVYSTGSASATTYSGTANPRYAICPRVITDPVDGFAFSPNLKAENVKKGVEILGVIGTNEGGGTSEPGIKFDFTKASPLMTDGSELDEKIIYLDVKALNIPNDISNFISFFAHLTNLSNFTNLNALSTTNATNMQKMFYYCYSITDLDLSSFDTSKVTDMSMMFTACYHLTSLDLSNFDTSQVTDMSYMFAYCPRLTNLKIDSFSTSQVTNMDNMFLYLDLTSLNLGSFDTSQVLSMNNMFGGCLSLTTLILAPNWASNNAIPSVDLTSCPLTKASVLDVLSKLADRTTTSYKPTLKLSSDTKALLSADEIKVATDKGWTVA